MTMINNVYGYKAAQSIILRKEVFKANTLPDLGGLEGVMFHEIVHWTGGNEWDAWSASVAANYVNGEYFKGLWQDDPAPPQWENKLFQDWNERNTQRIHFMNYVFKDMPEELKKKYIDNENSKISDPKGLLNEMRKHGQEIIGTK